MTDSLTLASKSAGFDSLTSNKLALESAQLWHGIGSGTLHGFEELVIDHPVSAAADLAFSWALGCGLSVLAYRTPPVAAAVGIVMKSMMATDLFARGVTTFMAGVDTWNHPDHYDRNEKVVEKQLGYGIVEYGLLGLGGGMGYHHANTKFDAIPGMSAALDDAFIRSGAEIQKLEVSKLFDQPLPRSQPFDGSPAARIYSENHSAILQIDTERSGLQYHGTGSVVDGKKGWIATNWHVGVPADDIGTITPDGTYSSLELIGGDRAADLAVFRTDKMPRRPWQEIERGSTSQLKGGDKLHGIGHPANVTLPTLTTGRFSSFLAEGDMLANRPGKVGILADLPQLPGSSGSPVFDDSGKVIAVLNSGVNNSEAGGTAVEHLDALLSALHANEPAKGSGQWLDVKSYVADQTAGANVKPPVTVRTTFEIRDASDSPGKLTDNPPPKREKIYGGFLPTVAGIPGAVAFGLDLVNALHPGKQK
ncbi:MAG TPA: trypsin-like peptidase domain-containing protein [Planktothrix sp.]|jgi:S1-C subfamily serine protease